jgi:hypothetical protein
MTRFILLPVIVALTMACGSDTPTSPTPVGGASLPAEVRVALEQSIADEYRAETIYQGVLTDFGSVPPFTNVLTAEQRHSTSLARLFEARGLPVPVNGWTAATVPHFPTVPAACTAGVVAERENIAIYDRLLPLDLPVDVRQVFENNRAASLFNHLPAFERCAG